MKIQHGVYLSAIAFWGLAIWGGLTIGFALKPHIQVWLGPEFKTIGTGFTILCCAYAVRSIGLALAEKIS